MITPSKKAGVQWKARHIAYVLKRFPRFSETFILNEILELERAGVEVTVFSLMHPPEEPRHPMLEKLKSEVIYLPRASHSDKFLGAVGPVEKMKAKKSGSVLDDGQVPLSDLMPGKTAKESAHLILQSATVATLASSRGCTHMHAHFASNATTAALIASRISKIPYSFTAHARDIFHTYTDVDTDRRLRRQKISESKFVATVSQYNKQHLQSIAYEEDQQKIKRVYNGVCQDTFGIKSESVVKSNNGIDFVCVGRFVEKKGIRFLLEATAILKAEGLLPKVTLVGDGPLKAQLVALSEALDIVDSINFAGLLPQDQLIKVLQTATCIVLPAIIADSGDRDGLPTVLLEGMTMGIPSITTEVAGIPEIVSSGQEGWLVPPGDSKHLAHAMRRALTEPETRKEMSMLARAKAREMFNLRTNVAFLYGLMSATDDDECDKQLQLIRSAESCV